MSTRPRIATVLVVGTLLATAITACSLSRSAQDEATRQARDYAHERARVIVNSMLGAERGRLDRRTAALAAAHADTAFAVKESDGILVVERPIAAQAVTGGGLTYDDADVVLCVRFVIDLAAAAVTLEDVACPEDYLAEHPTAAEVTLGDVDDDRLRASDPTPPIYSLYGPFDRIGVSEDIARAEELLPIAVAAVAPLTEAGNGVHADDVNDALRAAGFTRSIQTQPISSPRAAVLVGVSVGGGCIFGTVGPGFVELAAGGHIADGGCLPPR